MIDLHCHLLPHMDDGPQNWRDTMAMARAAVADGLTTIACTPHVPDAFAEQPVIDAFSERMVAVMAELRRRLTQSKIDLQVVAGGEVPVHMRPPLCRAFAINGGRYVLIELPASNLPAESTKLIFNLSVEGLTPIIAHAERNCGIIEHPDKLVSLMRAGALVQITGGSLLGEFGGRAQACAEYLLTTGRVSIMASDAHSPASRRPVLSEAVAAAARIIGWKEAARLVIQNPQTILDGHLLPTLA